MNSKIGLLIAAFMLITLNACDEESPFSGYGVNFKCDTAYHPFNQVTSFGQFITVRHKNGYKSYEVTDANGVVTTHNLSEIELRNKYQYGLGGLIIGTPSVSDGNIWVYDWACPTCESARYRLNVAHDGTGHATCPSCGNIYDLNNEGIPIRGKGRQLWRYRYMMFGTEIVIRN